MYFHVMMHAEACMHMHACGHVFGVYTVHAGKVAEYLATIKCLCFCLFINSLIIHYYLFIYLLLICCLFIPVFAFPSLTNHSAREPQADGAFSNQVFNKLKDEPTTLGAPLLCGGPLCTLWGAPSFQGAPQTQ